MIFRSLAFALVVSFAISLTQPALAAPAGRRGTEGVGGGGGPSAHGVNKTFYGAGFYVEPEPLKAEKIPGLVKLIEFINSRASLSEATKRELVSKLAPIDGHEYLKVIPEQFTPSVKKKLLAAYAHVKKVPVSKLKVYALTPENTKTTYLLPDFFKLLETDNSQPAILMHELRWLYPGDPSYEDVIRSEMATEAYMDKPNDLLRELEFISFFGSNEDLLRAYIRVDLKTGALAGLLTGRNEIPLTALFGESFFRCETCGKNAIAANIFLLTQKFPQSQVLKFLMSQAQAVVYANEQKEASFSDEGTFQTYRSSVALAHLQPKMVWVLDEDPQMRRSQVDFAQCTLKLPVHTLQVSVPSLTSVSLPHWTSTKTETHLALPLACNILSENLYLTLGPVRDLKVGVQ